MTPGPRPDVAECSLAELEDALEARGARRFRARQIYRWVYRQGVDEFGRMTDLPRALREQLSADFDITTPRVVRRDVSEDGTSKSLLQLADGKLIESVVIPESPIEQRQPAVPAEAAQKPEGIERSKRLARTTFCISTQVGCAMQCAFCLTGRMGIQRNLSAGEIAGQVRVLARDFDLLETPFNIVLMGMGEPLHNYDQTMKALRMLNEEHGFAVSPRRVTLSTVGVLPALERLATEPFMPNLAISLHSTTEDQRDRLVPVNRKYGLDDLLAACRRFPLKRRNRITFEYVLLNDVNDTPDDARRLARLLHGIRSKVNLLPLNEAPGIPFTRPSDERVNRFAQILADHFVTVSVRKSRGRDIRAACGQLIVEGERQSPAQRLASLMPV